MESHFNVTPFLLFHVERYKRKKTFFVPRGTNLKYFNDKYILAMYN